MSCTKQFLFLRWTHHTWKPNVSWAENYSTNDTDMWGRHTDGQYVTCHKQEFCTTCGKTRKSVDCGCDKARADQCAIRLQWIAGAPDHAGSHQNARN